MRRSLLPLLREKVAAKPTDEGPRASNDFLRFAAPAAEAGPHPALRATFSRKSGRRVSPGGATGPPLPPQRSSGVRPERFAILSSILGPISSES